MILQTSYPVGHIGNRHILPPCWLGILDLISHVEISHFQPAMIDDIVMRSDSMVSCEIWLILFNPRTHVVTQYS